MNRYIITLVALASGMLLMPERAAYAGDLVGVLNRYGAALGNLTGTLQGFSPAEERLQEGLKQLRDSFLSIIEKDTSNPFYANPFQTALDLRRDLLNRFPTPIDLIPILGENIQDDASTGLYLNTIGGLVGQEFLNAYKVPYNVAISVASVLDLASQKTIVGEVEKALVFSKNSPSLIMSYAEESPYEAQVKKYVDEFIKTKFVTWYQILGFAAAPTFDTLLKKYIWLNPLSFRIKMVENAVASATNGIEAAIELRRAIVSSGIKTAWKTEEERKALQERLFPTVGKIIKDKFSYPDTREFVEDLYILGKDLIELKKILPRKATKLVLLVMR